ncbi:hypothetical protein Spico_0187 [Parasphaerochaeta coccoides DSM 17374]|uniref:Uncharacterized protein n=1 Tax=Parasphaerochaeta coccoides (strain ATCC BAA-1237 / DSM 17374 / SPN1) TaxID=760011 RepID=F4GK00_PARC1|nr:hypothetical protein Spico_0187 [Parasphaerochaeta coccoides DSM 17374]
MSLRYFSYLIFKIVVLRSSLYFLLLLADRIFLCGFSVAP